MMGDFKMSRGDPQVGELSSKIIDAMREATTDGMEMTTVVAVLSNVLGQAIGCVDREYDRLEVMDTVTANMNIGLHITDPVGTPWGSA